MLPMIEILKLRAGYRNVWVESLMQRVLEDWKNDDGNSRAVNYLNLKDSGVLYARGRGGQSRYLRALVKRQNGFFEYHDGDMEDSRKTLSSTIVKSDVVLCPWDYLSHSTVKKIKT